MNLKKLIFGIAMVAAILPGVFAVSGTLFTDTTCSSINALSINGVKSGQCFPVNAGAPVQTGAIVCNGADSTTTFYTDTSCSISYARGGGIGNGEACQLVKRLSDNALIASGKVNCSAAFSITIPIALISMLCFIITKLNLSR